MLVHDAKPVIPGLIKESSIVSPKIPLHNITLSSLGCHPICFWEMTEYLWEVQFFPNKKWLCSPKVVLLCQSKWKLCDLAFIRWGEFHNTKGIHHWIDAWALAPRFYILLRNLCWLMYRHESGTVLIEININWAVFAKYLHRQLRGQQISSKIRALQERQKHT